MSQSLNLAGQVKVDGPGGLNWTVQTTETGRFKKLKVDGLRKWTVLRKKTVRSEKKILNGLNE